MQVHTMCEHSDEMNKEEEQEEQEEQEEDEAKFAGTLCANSQLRQRRRRRTRRTWLRVWSRSSLSPAPRRPPMASSSSMKTTHGEGLTDNACRVMWFQVTQEMRVYNVKNDVARQAS